MLHGFGHAGRFGEKPQFSLDRPRQTYNNLPSTQQLPRVASLTRTDYSPTERPRVDLARISGANLPRVASIERPPRELPEVKKVVNLATISQNNLPRVAQLQSSASVSSLGRLKPKQERDRWEEAARTFEPGLDREVGQGRASPGPGSYSAHASIVGNPN